MPEWRVYNHRWFRLVSYEGPGGWIPAAYIRESNEVADTITPIRDPARLFATEEEANNAALTIAIEWMMQTNPINSPPRIH
jgi:hypothetical protein